MVIGNRNQGENVYVCDGSLDDCFSRSKTRRVRAVRAIISGY